MSFVKKIIILNEVTKGYGKSELRGLATVEKNQGKAVCRLTVFNLADLKTNSYVFGLKSKNLKLQKFTLTQTSQNFPLDKDTDLDGVISCILVCAHTEKTVPVLWGSTDGKKILEGNMTDGFAGGDKYVPHETRSRDRGDSAKYAASETPAESAEGGDGKAGTAAAEEYQDYAVAAENYYAYGNEDAEAAVKPPADVFGAEISKAYGRGLTGGKFYNSIKGQLDELFESFPKEEYLCSLLKGTDWVRVDYDDNGRYYTVGLIIEDDTVKYICYGVPGKYAETPPQELKGFCQWLPFDAEAPGGEGYWMMYQDAENGKSVTLEMV